MNLGILELLIEIPVLILEIFLNREEKIERRIKKTKLRQLSDVKVGEYIKLEGTVIPYRKIVKSPLQKQNCIGYQVIVGREMSDGYDNEYVKEELIQNFYLKDNDQQIRIIPKNANIVLKKKKLGSSGLFKDASIDMSAFLKRHHLKSTSFGINKSLNFEEGTLKEGDLITVMGKVSTIKTRNQGTIKVIRQLKGSPLYLIHK